MVYILLAVFALGAIVSFLITSYIFKKAKPIGELVIAHDQDDPPYMFLKLKSDDDIPKDGIVSLAIKHEYYA